MYTLICPIAGQPVWAPAVGDIAGVIPFRWARQPFVVNGRQNNYRIYGRVPGRIPELCDPVGIAGYILQSFRADPCLDGHPAYTGIDDADRNMVALV